MLFVLQDSKFNCC